MFNRLGKAKEVNFEIRKNNYLFLKYFLPN